ncbi:hypothetical protein ACWA5Z_06625 [Testudinibacter sp. P80/BLE/0925]
MMKLMSPLMFAAVSTVCVIAAFTIGDGIDPLFMFLAGVHFGFFMLAVEDYLR